MGMVSLAMKSDGYAVDSAPNPYGYGTCICLTEEQVEALGLNRNPPATGAVVGIRALARVVRKTETSNPAQEAAEGESPNDIDVVLELQLTDLEVTAGGVTPSTSASMLYGGDND